jgi:hypothetical protein
VTGSSASSYDIEDGYLRIELEGEAALVVPTL